MSSVRSDFKAEMDQQREVMRAEMEATLQRMPPVDPRVLRRVVIGFRLFALVTIALTLGAYLGGAGELLDMVSIAYMCLLAIVASGFIPGLAKDWRFSVVVSIAYMGAFAIIPVVAGVAVLGVYQIFAVVFGALGVVLILRSRSKAR